MKTTRMLILIALRNLIQARGRTAFLGGAIGLVTLLLVLLLSLSQGISENIVRSATTLTTGHVNVTGFYKASPAAVAPVMIEAGKLKALVSDSPEIDYVVDRNRGWARLVSPTNALQSLIVGVSIDDEPGLAELLRLAPEADYREGGAAQIKGDVSQLKQKNVAVIFATQAKNLEVTVGDAITLRTQNFNGAANTIDVTIVGVARDIGLLSNFSVFVPKQVIRDLYQLRPDTSGALQIYLKDRDRSREVMTALRTKLDGAGYELMEYQPSPFFTKFGTVRGEDWVGQKLDLTTWEDEVDFLTWILTALDTVSFTLIVILVTIIAIGIMNTMWIAVRKRTGEIGTLRAIGMTRAQILQMFLWEAFLLGAIATTIGALVGAAVAVGIDSARIGVPVDAMRAILLSDTFKLSVTARHLAASVAALTAFTVLSALWPAIRAARLQPVEAIQQAE